MQNKRAHFLRWLSLPVVVLAAAVLLAPSLWAEDDAPRITDEGYPETTRVRSLFDHDQHMELYPDYPEGCIKCHHIYDDEGNLVPDETSEGIPCSDCHEYDSTEDNPVELTEAYHQSCIGCHDAVDQGPVTCGNCHVK